MKRKAAVALLCLLPLPGLPPPAARTAARPPVDPGWPRAYALAQGGTALVHAPQVASWDGRRLAAWAAVSYQAPGAGEPAPGAVRLEADTTVAVDERLVRLDTFQIPEFHFPSLPREQERAVAHDLEKAISDAEKVIALDRVLAGVDKSRVSFQETPGLKAEPPRIFLSTRFAVLVNFDGTPVWSPVKDTGLQFAVNTNWDVFEHPPSKTFYLRDQDSWLQAAAAEGPWRPAGRLPESFARLPADDNWKDVRANLPGRPLTVQTAPAVFVSTEPAELILLSGEPRYERVWGTGLFWVANTESDLFRLGEDGPFYYLVAGRWFSAPGLDGPWTFATPRLPEDFRKIPLEHERSRVLAAVPGTDQAAEAVLLTRVPRAARVHRKELEAPEVIYQGDPVFEPIEGTSLARAVNTDKDVVQHDAVFYLCYQGVWFQGGDAAGPWAVAASVPAEIYRIPASSPIHHVTYVTVTDDDPGDDWVTSSYVAGYIGLMTGWGCAVWGTGWRYPPYVGSGEENPAYFPHPATYGFGAWYNPWTGAYGRGSSVYGPYGGAGAGASYNPRARVYERAAAVYGSYNAYGVTEAWNPRARTRRGANVYGAPRASRVTRTDAGDLYAGRDGNVYRRHEGAWQKWSGGSWSEADPRSRSQLDRDLAARLNGARRTRDAASFRQSPSRTLAASYRPGALQPGGRQ
ncbi:MAG TPA: hypothetical protein VF789_02695 [Thermoanaerobaculia bacterium]